MIENLNNLERSHSCGALRKDDVGQRVTLMGWCARRRDFGPLTFIDLRDRDGITQVVVNQEKATRAHAKAKEVRGEYVLVAIGHVVLRDEGARNPKLATGEVEVQATEIIILNDARPLPFQLDAADSVLASEDLRLKYRYLDLRRPQLQANLRLRHRMILEINRYMDEQGFTQIETPNLIKSTPEGARDYIVPSRVQPGKFFALPQSPQIFKQICMIAGLDKYYQIARCFRDEDLRADRQPEFSQLDVEMSFATPDQVYALVEGMFARIFRLKGAELTTPFPRLTFGEVMRRFGSDKPDLRIEGMELQDLSATLGETTFAPYASVLTTGGVIKGIVVSGGASMSRKTLDELQEFVRRYGATALAWIKLGDELTSSLLKTLGHDTVVDLAGVAGAQKGDAILIVAGKPDVVMASLGSLRNEIARREKLLPANVYAPLWVTEFPMFEFHEDDGRYFSMHHPFTSPLDDDVPLLERAVNGETKLFGELRAKAYDAVINGVEVAGGSIRIHRRDVQSLVFKALGMSEETARARFGFFLDALAYGTPPHGGIASGIERTLMVLVPTENIRDVMAFPKTASAKDLMIDAPGEVDPELLDELSIRLLKGRELELLLRSLLDPHQDHGLKTFALDRLIQLLTIETVSAPGPEYDLGLEHPLKIESIADAKIRTNWVGFDVAIDGIKAVSGKNVQILIEAKHKEQLTKSDFSSFFFQVIGHRQTHNGTNITIPILIHRMDDENYDRWLTDFGPRAPWFAVNFKTFIAEVLGPCLQHPSITEGAKARLLDFVETTS